MAGNMYGGCFILGYAAFALIFYGMGQIWSDIPVNFYRLESSPIIEDKEVMHKWNEVHGLMWVIYGFFFIILTILFAMPLSETVLKIAAPLLVIVPLPVMITIHMYFKKKLLK